MAKGNRQGGAALRKVWTGSDRHGTVQVFDQDGNRYLALDGSIRQSGINLGNPEALIFESTRALAATLCFVPDPQKILLLGLGGGSMARFFYRFLPQCQIDVVELRPAVIHAAFAHFGLPKDPRLRVLLGDAVDFIKTVRPGVYDLILIDLFNSDGGAEVIHSRDLFRRARPCLTDRGILACNFWQRETSAQSVRHHRLFDDFGNAVLTLNTPIGNVIYLAFAREVLPDQAAVQKEARRLTRNLPIDMTHQLASIEWEKPMA